MDWRDLGFAGFDLSGSFTWLDPKTIDDPVFPAAEGKDLPQVPRRRATRVATYRVTPALSVTFAGRYSSRSFATLDNKDPVTHTYQGFDGYLVLEARVTYRLRPQLELAAGMDNLNNDRYFLFHPFPQRSADAELTYRW
jgi:iron complex outermembrane receptor protein